MSQISYLEIYNSWLMIDLEHNKHAIIHADSFVTPLHVSKVISESEMESVNREIANVDKNRKLFLEILPSKGETGVETMIEIMTNNNDWELLDYFNKARGIKIVPNKIWGDVPKRNLCFINRQSVTENVELVFRKTVDNNNNHSCTVVICGMGGVGKTLIAAQFLHENEKKYKTAFWIKSETVNEEFHQINEDFKLNVNDDEEFIKRMKTWFGQFCAPCLLVFDDAEKIEQIERYLPPKGCCILITSRNNNWRLSQVDICFPLGVFSNEEAKSYMQNMLAQKMALDNEDLSRLTSMLGHLPLALSQACAYIGECCWQISDYIKDLEKQLKLSTSLGISTVLPAVFATWSITQEAIKNKSPLADKLLSICAYLQPDAIPTFLLKDAVGLLDIPMIEDEGREFSKAMRTLTNFSLLNHTEKQDQVSIHCLLQAAIRHQQRSEEKIHLTVLTRNLIFSYPKTRKMTDIRNKRQLLPHLSEATKNVNGWNDSQPKDKLQFELIMQLLEKNADAFYEMGITKEAANMLESVLKMKTDQFNCDHPQVAGTLVNLGEIYHLLGDTKKAKELLERALVIEEKHFGPDHPQVVVTLGNLGNAYKSLGDTKKAKELYERALVIQEEHFGPDHPQVAVTVGNLGAAYTSLGDTKKAKELFERALVIQEEHFGPDHPQVAVTVSNLGAAYKSLGDTKKAKELIERALVIQEEHFGPDHPQVAVTVGNLGAVYSSLGDTKKAKELFERALVIKEKHFGPDHPQVAVTLDKLGAVYNSLGDTKKAKELLERALAIKKEHFGPDHPNVAATLSNLGNAYDSLGDMKKAKEFYERALVIHEEHFGPDHPHVANTLGNLGLAYNSLGDTKKAKELYERALAIKKEHFGPDHPEVAITLGHLGTAYYSLGDMKKAKELYERALVIQEKYFGPDHSEVAVTLVNLGAAYDSLLGDTKKAKELYERALVIQEKYFGPDHSEVANTLGNLGLAYNSLGNTKKAIELYKRASVIREEHFGSYYPKVAFTVGISFDKQTKVKTFVENCPEVSQARSIMSLKGTFDILAELWRGLKPKSYMLDCFLYFADFGCDNSKTIVSFRQVFEDDSAQMFKRIFIVGDAGCGKSTFVNRMALDLTYGSKGDGEYLQLKFDSVVYVDLQTLSMNVEHYIEHCLPEAFKSEDADILVILDGFDELTEHSEFYDSALRVIKGKALPLFTVIATVSWHVHLKYVDHLSQHCCLKFRSFDENEMTSFLNERFIAFPPTQKNLNLGLLLENTLFCSIYCSMFGDGHKGIIEIEDSYDFVKALVDNWVADNAKTNAMLDGENHLEEIGQVAFQLLDSRTVSLIRKCQKICSDDISTKFLTMQTTEASTYFKEPSLFHQLIAEYLAARYFARSLAQNAICTEHVTMFESNSISSPVKESFFYFFLHELFSSHLEKNVDPSFIAHFFAIAEIRIMWSCKWPMEEIPLDKVETLRFFYFNCEFINHKRFFPTLSKCSALSELSIVGCHISTEASSELAKLTDQGYFQILKLLDLSDNANIGRSSDLLKVLFKCCQLETLRLDKCSMTNSSMEIFLQTFSSENFQYLTLLSLCFNIDYDVDDSFIFALSKCPKINLIMLWEVRGCKLSAVCREIRKLIESRGCFIDV